MNPRNPKHETNPLQPYSNKNLSLGQIQKVEPVFRPPHVPDWTVGLLGSRVVWLLPVIFDSYMGLGFIEFRL